MDETDFDEFFACVNDGATPFEWQRRLVRHLVAQQAWPDVIAAPTGAGKSAVVEAHVFVNALASATGSIRLPRRLALIVDRRGLVDSHAERAERIRRLLATASGGLLSEMADALKKTAFASGMTPSIPLRVVVLRGAVAPSRDWLNDPTGCQIICATPDMWGSRLLLRGYGSSPNARPREAGMLALDSVAVVDEAHMNRQLVVTARAVGALASESAVTLGVPGLQVTSVSATPAEGRPLVTVGVSDSDLTADADLRERLTKPKPVAVVESPAWPVRGRAPASHVGCLCNEVENLWRQVPGTVGCVVNRVDTAVQVADRLKAQGRTVALWVGRLRPMDTLQLHTENPELFDSSCSPQMDVLVATQTVEVGVDLDLQGLVTELAPAVSLAQRAGRVNRRGLRERGPITVVVPPGRLGSPAALPYAAGDLAAGLAWLSPIVADPGGLSGANLLASPPPATAPR
ncbi:MAG: type I-U CRISPR-associated helicase/endonuclease Cas3, partial [Propionicimonas sp.]|nr:type I-U CRISPR-associated helicase/endonuclease Cas3 [Propionicimonas sp.]